MTKKEYALIWYNKGCINTLNNLEVPYDDRDNFDDAWDELGEDEVLIINDNKNTTL